MYCCANGEEKATSEEGNYRTGEGRSIGQEGQGAAAMETKPDREGEGISIGRTRGIVTKDSDIGCKKKDLTFL